MLFRSGAQARPREKNRGRARPELRNGRSITAILVLCSGTGSIDRAFERKGWDVVSVDWLAKFRPTLCVDVIDWDYRTAFPKDYFQFVWASPACTQFSIARTTRKPRDLEGGRTRWSSGAWRSRSTLAASGAWRILPPAF